MEISRARFGCRARCSGRVARAFGGWLVVCFVLACASLSAQDSDPAKASGVWAVKVKEPALKLIAPRTGFGAGRVYWYLIYTLHNESDSAREIMVSVTARTNAKKTYSDLFLPGVERAAERRERRGLWGKTDQREASAGRDAKSPKYQYFTLKPREKRRCIAVFNEIDPTITKATLHVSGLSNDVRVLTREDGNKVLETRVKELAFERLGDEFAIIEDSFRLTRNTWSKKEVVLAPTSNGSR